MIAKTIQILQAFPQIAASVGVDHIYPVQRKQTAPACSIVVDVLDVRTNPTKHLTSGLDFYDLQVTSYGSTPLEVEKVALYCRTALDKFTEVTQTDDIEIRFNEQETGIVEGSEQFVVIQGYTVAASRAAVSAHS